MDATYRIVSRGVVEVDDGLKRETPLRYNHSNLILAIANTRQSRHVYASEQAYDRALKILTGALDYLEENS